MSSDVLIAGWVQKLERSFEKIGLKNFSRRFCIIFKSKPQVLYYGKSDTDRSAWKPVRLEEYDVTMADYSASKDAAGSAPLRVIALVSPYATDASKSVFVFHPESELDCQNWLQVLQWCVANTAPSLYMVPVGDVLMRGYLLKRMKLKPNEFRYFMATRNFVHFIKCKDGGFRLKYCFPISNIRSTYQGSQFSFTVQPSASLVAMAQLAASQTAAAGGAGSPAGSVAAIPQPKQFQLVCSSEEEAATWCAAIEASRERISTGAPISLGDNNAKISFKGSSMTLQAFGATYPPVVLDKITLDSWGQYVRNSLQKQYGTHCTIICPLTDLQDGLISPEDMARGFIADWAADARTLPMVHQISKFSSLVTVAAQKNLPHLRYLLQDSSVLNIQTLDPQEVANAAIVVMQNDAIELMKCLLDSGALRDPSLVSEHLSLCKSHAMLKLLSERLRVRISESASPDALHQFCKGGDVEMVKELLQAGVSPQTPHPSTGETALHAAAAEGRIAVADLLIQNGCPVDYEDGRGRTALFAAIRYGQEAFALHLIKRFLPAGAGAGTGATAGGSSGQLRLVLSEAGNRASVLHFCAAYPCPKVAREIIDRGLQLPTVVDGKGATALDVCLGVGNEEVFKVFLSCFSSQKNLQLPENVLSAILRSERRRMIELLFSTTGMDHTAAWKVCCKAASLDGLRSILDVSGENGLAEIPEQSLFWILSSGAEQVKLEECLHFVCRLVDTNTRDNESGQTALHQAVTGGMLGSIRILLDAGTNMNLTESQYGYSALHVAAEMANHFALSILAEHLSCDINSCTVKSAGAKGSGETALRIAVAQRNAKSMDILLRSGAVPHVGAALHRAVACNDLSLVDLLLRYGARPDALNGNNETALQVAERKQADPQIVQTLRAALSSPASYDIEGSSAVHLLTSKRSVDGLRQLLNSTSGAGDPGSNSAVNVNLKNGTGQTALHLAAELGFVDVAKVLVEAGASIHARNRNFRTPLHLACICWASGNRAGASGTSRHEILDFLLASGSSNLLLALDDTDSTPLHVMPSLLSELSISEVNSLPRWKYLRLRKSLPPQASKQLVSLYESALRGAAPLPALTLAVSSSATATATATASPRPSDAGLPALGGVGRGPAERKGLAVGNAAGAGVGAGAGEISPEGGKLPARTPVLRPSRKKHAWELDPKDINLQKELGRGGFGVVFKGLWHGTTVAVKKLLNQKLDQAGLDTFMAEVSILSDLRHPNIVLFMGSCLDPANLFYVTEFCAKGSLFEVLHSERQQLPLKTRIHMAADIARGMAYLHLADPPIIHQDLKSLNILVSESNVCKVADFGLSAQKSGYRSIPSRGGTIFYSAPEVLQKGSVSEAGDVYSFAIILWELMTCDYPFYDFVAKNRPPEELQRQVIQNNLRPAIPDDLNRSFPEISRLIRSCWHPNSAVRPRFSQILDVLLKFV